ncbi:MAG: dihydrolipoyllysine-residue acetyltransferase [Gammaproteobacteria bacterium]|nr:dihydrolipoyllysine-residue acetyltransferase [Gammaproteobacteria bacterium]
MATDVVVPDIGDFADVEVIEVLISPGDQVEAEESILTLESDKATMEIPSPFSGAVTEVKVAVGDRINVGDLVALMDVADTDEQQPAAVEATKVEPAAAPAPVEPASAAKTTPAAGRLPGEKEQKPAPAPAEAPKRITSGKAHASPAVRLFARKLGVEITTVEGSGPKGRVTKADVQNHVKQVVASHDQTAATSGSAIPAIPEIDFSKFGKTETVELGRIKKLSGTHLKRAWLNIPHVTQFDEADITEMEAFRKENKPEAEKMGIRMTFMPFLMRACAKALKEMPEFNSSLTADAEHLVMKNYVNIGIAVDTPNGLMVPVIRDVDKKGIYDLAAELMELSGRAREGQLSAEDMQGGCFSISSLGGIGGVQFTPIVNAPEVAILGVSRATMKPVWNGEDFEPRLIMPFSLSYDHRVIDGAQGVRFTSYINKLLSDIRRLLL